MIWQLFDSCPLTLVKTTTQIGRKCYQMLFFDHGFVMTGNIGLTFNIARVKEVPPHMFLESAAAITRQQVRISFSLLLLEGEG